MNGTCFTVINVNLHLACLCAVPSRSKPVVKVTVTHIDFWFCPFRIGIVITHRCAVGKVVVKVAVFENVSGILLASATDAVSVNKAVSNYTTVFVLDGIWCIYAIVIIA